MYKIWLKEATHLVADLQILLHETQHLSLQVSIYGSTSISQLRGNSSACLMGSFDPIRI